MSLSIQVVWGGRWDAGQRLTPELINRIFEGASFLLQGTLDAAAIGPGSLTSSMIGVTFVNGLPTAVPEGIDWVIGHDVSVGAPRKFSINAILSLGFGAAAAVTVLSETDEFGVLVAGVAKKITLPLVRTELIDAPNTLIWTTVAITADRVLIHDASANESKSATAAQLVRSVTDRVVATAGSATVYTVTSGYTLAAFATGARLIAKFHAANGTAPTINVDGLGAKALLTADAQAITPGRIAIGQIVELVYDAAAAAGAGAWLALTITAIGGRSSVVFNGSLVVAWYGSEDGVVDAANDWITTVGPHSLVTGEVVWFRDAPGAMPLANKPYYAIVLDAYRYRLGSTKANALAGVYLQIPAQDTLDVYHWASDPILSAVNVDGVISPYPGRYIIDFSVPMANANYAVAVTSEYKDAVSNQATNACVDASYQDRDTEGFGIRTFVNTNDDVASKWISVIVFP